MWTRRNATSSLVKACAYGRSRRHHFLAAKDLDVAKRALAAIRRGVLPLATHPGLGRVRDPRQSDIREWPIKFGPIGYLVTYKTSADVVTLLGVRHQKQLP